jgi:hypothetical protein
VFLCVPDNEDSLRSCSAWLASFNLYCLVARWDLPSISSEKLLSADKSCWCVIYWQMVIRQPGSRGSACRNSLYLPLGNEDAGLRNLYLFIWKKIHHEPTEKTLAFTTVDRKPLDPDTFRAYLRKLASVRRNAEFNGFICRSLLAARNRRHSSAGKRTIR